MQRRHWLLLLLWAFLVGAILAWLIAADYGCQPDEVIEPMPPVNERSLLKGMV